LEAKIGVKSLSRGSLMEKETRRRASIKSRKCGVNPGFAGSAEGKGRVAPKRRRGLYIYRTKNKKRGTGKRRVKKSVGSGSYGQCSPE